MVNDEYMGDSADTSTTPIAEDARNLSRFGTFLASGGYGAGTAQGQVSERANMLRGAQLQDLLRHQGMWRPTMPSSSSSRAQPNIFKEHDDDEDQKLISRLVKEDVRGADEEKSRERERWEKLEAERLQHMDELRSELLRAKENEDRIRGKREYWRQEAEYCQQENHQGDDYEEGEEEEAVPPSESPTNLGPSGPSGGGPGGPGDGDDSKKSPTNRGGPAGGDPPGPPSDTPTDEGVADVTEVKISRREADKIIVPPFPKVTHLDSWMSYCIANVLGACADPNHEEWIAWMNPAFRPNPDIDALNDSGHIKFKSIDIKLGIAMSATLKSAGDVALDLYLDVNRKSSKYVVEESKLIKGRQIIAMMYESFRTRDGLDMIVTLEYLIKLQYQGDQHMSVFKQTWLECIDRMRPEDVPSDNALRDTLHAKIKDSPALKWELLVSYDMLNYDDPKRSYQHLLHLMDRCIQRSREQKMLKQTQNGLQLMIQGKDTLSAMAAKTKGSETATPAPKKPTKPPKNESAAPVLPQSKAKAHAKAKAGKGKGKGKDRERSASVDAKNKMKHIRCKFFFSETGECRNGDKCPYSHSKKTPERGRGTTPDHSRAPSRSPSAGQGENNCPYKHVDPATPAEGKPKAAPKAEAKGKAEAKPKPKGKAKALPAAPAIRLCRAWNPLAPAIQKRNVKYDDDVSDCSSLDSDADSECSTDDEAVANVPKPKSKGRRTQSTDSEAKKKVTFASDVRFQSSKPRRSYKDRGDKIIKVNVEKRFVDNSSRATELGFSMHKARLKAQMMSDMLQDGRPGDRHVYVRVPGSDRVTEIIFYDGEDELYEYEVGPEERKKVKAFSIVNCMVQRCNLHGYGQRSSFSWTQDAVMT